jgi:uncharacterized membrane protein
MGIISGTDIPRGYEGNMTILRGLLYGLTYFGVVIVSPIFILAAMINVILTMFLHGSDSKTTDTPIKSDP